MLTGEMKIVKKVLMCATVASMIGQFNIENIKLLINLGYEVHVACNFKDKSVWTEERISRFIEELEELNVKYYQIDFSRTPFDVVNNKRAYMQLKELFMKNSYNMVHCHTPVASVLCRMISHKMKVKCIYTAHGFHFYKGAPIKNWLLFYPIEKFLSYWTDVLITINKEDYYRANKKFNSKAIEYVPGVGIDVDELKNKIVDTNMVRTSLGVANDEVMLLSVGELSRRKNHVAVIKALNKINDKRIKFFICGKGGARVYLQKLINKYGLTDNINLLGFRTDIVDLCKSADFFVFPSLQEGLPVALMEAMACETPILCSKIRGNVDLIEYRDCLFNPKSVNEIQSVITNNISILDNYGKKEFENMINRNNEIISMCDFKIIRESMKNIYRSC